MTDELTAKFLRLFPCNPYSVTFCQRLGNKRDDKGKLVVNYWTETNRDENGKYQPRPVTAQEVEKHLAGKCALVLKPTQGDGRVSWISGDVDNYGPDTFIACAARIEKAGLPLHPFKSKSGGVHPICFLAEPIPQSQATELARRFMAQLGYSTQEVFPNGEGLGLGVEVPFFGDAKALEEFEPILYHYDGNGTQTAYGVPPADPHVAENWQPKSDAKPLGLKIPAGIDFEKELALRLHFEKHVEGATTYFNYHNIDGQACLIQGTIHGAQSNNARQCGFEVTDGRVCHKCFDSDCQAGDAAKTRRAITALDQRNKDLPSLLALLTRRVKADGASVEITLRSYDRIPKEHLVYLWPKYLPLGKLVHLAGNSGEGKSPLSVDIAARVSKGLPWPDDAPNELGPRSVILLTAEDDAGDTVRPRLELAGADLTKIHDIVCTMRKESSVQERMLALSTDLTALLEKTREVPDLALVVIDPVTNYLGPKVKINLDEEVRQVLMPLALGAKELSFTALTVGHLNRRERGTDPLQRILGAAAFHAVARFIYLVGSDPDDTSPHAHVLIQKRGTAAPSLRYQTYAKQVEWDGKESEVVGVEWRGTSSATAEDAVDPTGNREKSEMAQAAQELAEILKAGRLPKTEALQLLGDAGHNVDGINVTRLLRAAGAGSKRFPPDKWYSWFLPGPKDR